MHCRHQAENSYFKANFQPIETPINKPTLENEIKFKNSKIYHVWSVLLYKCLTWTVTESMKERIKSCKM